MVPYLISNPRPRKTFLVQPRGSRRKVHMGVLHMRSLSLVGLTGSVVLLSAGMVQANNTYYWANQIVNYNPGTSSSTYSVGAYYQNSGSYAGSWYGYLQPNGGAAYPSGSYTVTPFEAGYDNHNLLGIGPGGSVEFQFACPVTTSTGINSGFNLGIHAGVGLNDASGSYSGSTGAVAATYTYLREADVAISQDGTNWVYATGTTGWTSNPSQASPIVFDIPSNYYNDASIAPDGSGNVVQNDDYPTADFSAPFTGELSSFNGLDDYQAVLDELNGSAGGTWFDLNGTGLTNVEYVQLFVPDDANYNMYVQAVVGVAPEPKSLPLLFLGSMLLLNRRRKRKI